MKKIILILMVIFMPLISQSQTKNNIQPILEVSQNDIFYKKLTKKIDYLFNVDTKSFQSKLLKSEELFTTKGFDNYLESIRHNGLLDVINLKNNPIKIETVKKSYRMSYLPEESIQAADKNIKIYVSFTSVLIFNKNNKSHEIKIKGIISVMKDSELIDSISYQLEKPFDLID